MPIRKELSFALRILQRNVGFTVAAVLCLALGIGATTAIFSVVHAVLLRPLAYEAPADLARIYTEFPTFPGGGLPRFAVSPPEFLELRRDLKSFRTLDAWVSTGGNLVGADTPLRVQVSYVSGTLLETLGVKPLRGRLIAPHNDTPTAERTAVISEGLWKRAFGSDTNIVGRDARLDGRVCRIIGVMPAAFQFPPGAIDPTEIWVPLQLDPAKPGGRGSHFLSLVGRLNPGTSLAQAKSELSGLVNQRGQDATNKQHNLHPKNHPALAFGLQDEVVRTVRPAMLALLAAVGFVLLIACVNVANLLLSRAESRQREIAVRRAIGANRTQLFRQLLVEGVVLSLIGAVGGVILAYAGLGVLLQMAGTSIPRAAEITLDWRMLLFALSIALATGLFFGFAPLAQFSGGTMHDSLKSGVGRTTASGSSNAIRRGLVISELALALVLLIGSGLMVQTFWRLQAVTVGVNTDKVLTMGTFLPQSSYPDAEARRRFWESVGEQLNRMPGAASATISSDLPPLRPLLANDTQIEGFVPRPGGPIQNIDYWTTVGDRFFETMQLNLVEGRYVDRRDTQNSAKVVNVNLTMARTFWPGQSAVGRRIRFDDKGEWYTVAGVVADVKNAGLDKPAGTELYLPFRQAPNGFGLSAANLVIRSAGPDPERLTDAARRIVSSADATVPIARVRTLDELVQRSRARPRFLAFLLTTFSGVALALAAFGIYGVIAYSVARRTSEFGIRMALGAQPGSVLGMVLRQGMTLAAIGIGAGMLAALFLTRFLQDLLFGVKALDPITFVAMIAGLALVTLLACWIPALRATRVDPSIALRVE